MEVGVSMVDWLTYKGQNPWTCVALHDKVEYNEGSYIAKSPKVSGGTPTWEIRKTGPAITDTHVPCGYWFKDYDSDSQLRRICLGLEMGYTKTSMIVDEQQILYVKDSNGDTVDCQITTWTLEGVGSLSNSVGPTTVYTAPSTSMPEADSATITLWCGGAVKDTLVVSVAHKCTCVDTILYTTLQMSVGGTQTLQASGAGSDDCYTWSTDFGSLSASTGKSVVFTAPSSNANCSSNPTITLTCGGSVVDTITIAVNAHSGTEIAYEEYINKSCAQRTYWTDCYVTRMRYFCNGTLDTNPYWSNCVIGAQSQEKHPPPQYPTPTDCPTCYNHATGLACGSRGRTINELLALPNDVRTEWLKAAGCCPAQLL